MNIQQPTSNIQFSPMYRTRVVGCWALDVRCWLFSCVPFLIENSPAPLQSLGMTKSVFTGPVYVVRDNIDTDQIISAQYLNLVPTIAEEYELSLIHISEPTRL